MQRKSWRRRRNPFCFPWCWINSLPRSRRWVGFVSFYFNFSSHLIKFNSFFLNTPNLLPSELPVSIVKPLRDKTALEKHRVILECTVSSPRCNATWFKGKQELVPSDRMEITADGCTHKLVIHQVAVEDEGTYSIEVGEHTSKAKLMVEGKLEAKYCFEKLSYSHFV